MLIHLIKKRSLFEMRISAYRYDFPCIKLAFYAILNPLLSQVLESGSEDHLASTLQFHYGFPLLILILYIVRIFEIMTLP